MSGEFLGTSYDHGFAAGCDSMKTELELLRESHRMEVEHLRDLNELMRAHAEIGRKWVENSALENWFPITAEELTNLRAELARVKEGLKIAIDALKPFADVADLPVKMRSIPPENIYIWAQSGGENAFLSVQHLLNAKHAIAVIDEARREK